MSRYELISFDLQGTLSDSAFCDEFWLELLPSLYAARNEVHIDDAKATMRTEFKRLGEYHRLYHDHHHWVRELSPGSTFVEQIKALKSRPHLYPDTMSLVDQLDGSATLIIISATTHDFIEIEMGEFANKFDHVFSTLDDFNLPGKPVEVFKSVALKFGVSPEKCLHVGDHPELDVANAAKAGWRSFHIDKKKPRQEVVEDLRQELRKHLKTTEQARHVKA